jgi:hypothetical protein
METNFAVGDKVKIVRGLEECVGKTGIIIKDGGFQKGGSRKLGEEYKNWLHQWVVKLDDTGEELAFFDGSLEKIG